MLNKAALAAFVLGLKITAKEAAKQLVSTGKSINMAPHLLAVAQHD